MSYRSRVAEAIRLDDMEGLYSLAVECALIADKKSVQQAIGNKEPYSTFFDEAWALYPKRSGSNSKREAWGAWQARLRSKSLIAPIDMIQGVKRYRAWCESTGKVGTETVMQARRFFGPAMPFSEKWEVGGPALAFATDGGAAKHRAAMQREAAAKAEREQIDAEVAEGNARRAKAEKWGREHPEEYARMRAEVLPEFAQLPDNAFTRVAIATEVARRLEGRHAAH